MTGGKWYFEGEYSIFFNNAFVSCERCSVSVGLQVIMHYKYISNSAEWQERLSVLFEICKNLKDISFDKQDPSQALWDNFKH